MKPVRVVISFADAEQAAKFLNTLDRETFARSRVEDEPHRCVECGRHEGQTHVAGCFLGDE